MATQITEEKFLDYERVRLSGAYNMFDPKARKMTDLTKSEWIHIIKDYDKFAKAWLIKSNGG